MMKSRYPIKQKHLANLAKDLGCDLSRVGYLPVGKALANRLGRIAPNTRQGCKAMIFEFLYPNGRTAQAMVDVRKASTKREKPAVTTAWYGDVNGDAFLSSYEWRRIRLVVLKRDGRRCACCGASPETGAVMHVDHIKPRRLFPHLALDPDNLQVLCAACNHGKGNWDMTDFRAPVVVEPEMTEEQREHMRAILMRD